MSGVVRDMAESSIPVGGCREGNPAGMNSLRDRLHSLECAAVLSSWGPRQAPADSHVPSAIDSAYFPGQIFARDGRLRRRFSRHRTWSVPDKRLSLTLNGEGPCRDHYVFPAGRYQIFHNSLIKVH